jgi:hypothetical protein
MSLKAKIENYKKMSEELRHLVRILRNSRYYDEIFPIVDERHRIACDIEEILAIHGEMEMP